MAFSQEQIEKAIAVVIGAFGRFDSYEWDEDGKLTANFKSNSRRSDRQVYIDFDKDDDGDYSGHMNVSQSEYYPGDSAGWGLAQHITDALNNPDEYENLGYDDKRIYPSDDESEEYESGNLGLLLGGIAVVAGVGYGIYRGGKYLFTAIKEKVNQKKQNQDSPDEVEEETTVEKDSTVELLQMASQVTHIFKELPEDLTLGQFKEAFNKAREIDLRSPFIYVRKNKDRFTPEMIEYAQSFYEQEI